MIFDSNSQPLRFTLRAAMHILRLAEIMLSLLEGDNSNTIKKDIINHANSVTQLYSIQHQQAVDFHEITESLIQALFTFIGANSQHHNVLSTFSISKTMLLQRSPSKLQKKESLDMALAILESRRNIQLRRIANTTYITLHNDQITLPSYQP